MILQACTLDSLASLSSVSMHFLRRTSPLIYKEITVDGKLAARLFCERVSSDIPIFLAEALPFVSISESSHASCFPFSPPRSLQNPEDQYRNRRIHPFLSFENTRKITLDNGVRLALHHKTLEVSIGRFSSKTLNLDSIAFRSTQPTHGESHPHPRCSPPLELTSPFFSSRQTSTSGLPSSPSSTLTTSVPSLLSPLLSET